MKWRIRPKGFLGSGYGGAPDTLTDEKCPSCGRPLLVSEVKKQKCRMCGYTFSASGGKKRSYCSKAEKIRKIQLAIEAKRAAGIRYLTPKSRAQMVRIHELMARGPLSVKVIDIDLAQQGWISIYDDAPGNESVDFTHPRSMEATDILEKAERRYFGR